MGKASLAEKGDLAALVSKPKPGSKVVNNNVNNAVQKTLAPQNTLAENSIIGLLTKQKTFDRELENMGYMAGIQK